MAALLVLAAGGSGGRGAGTGIAWKKDSQRGNCLQSEASPDLAGTGGLPAKLSRDGVHPNGAGHALMAPLVEAGIEMALKDGPRE